MYRRATDQISSEELAQESLWIQRLILKDSKNRVNFLEKKIMKVLELMLLHGQDPAYVWFHSRQFFIDLDVEPQA